MSHWINDSIENSWMRTIDDNKIYVMKSNYTDISHVTVYYWYILFPTISMRYSWEYMFPNSNGTFSNAKEAKDAADIFCIKYEKLKAFL